VKADTSVSGRGVVRCADESALRRVLSRISPTVPFQLQEEVRNAVAFINVQYRVHKGVLKRGVVTEQLLDGYAHKGNRYPSAYTPWKHTDPLARYMYQEGIEDVFAFDLAIDAEGGHWILECNPRYNGSSYPSAIAQKLCIPSWSAHSFETRFLALDDVRLGVLEYDPSTKSGAVLVNWGAVQQGMLGVLIAGTTTQQEELAHRLRGMLT
jgi:hypothetical protein